MKTHFFNKRFISFLLAFLFIAMAANSYALDIGGTKPIEVETIAELRTHSGNLTSNKEAIVLGYYEIGDGAGGPPRAWVESATPGLYIDNGGTVIVPNGGDGSDAWLWKTFIGGITFEEFGAIGDGVDVGDMARCQAAIDTGLPIYQRKSGLYLIDPSVGLKMRQGTSIIGAGQAQTGFLAKYNVAGSVITRDFTPGVPNERVQQVELQNISVFLNHLHQASEPANIQQGFNFRDIGRSRIINCYGGNFRFGLAETLFPNAVDKTQAMRGYPFVLGNRSSSDIDYAGGEVNKIINCRSWWSRKGITLDDQDLTGGVSATYNAIISGNDIQTIEVGINQGSQFNTGCTYSDNLIQDLKKSAGSTNSVYAYSILGKRSKVSGGYLESNPIGLDFAVHFGTSALDNEVLPFHHSIPDAQFLEDLSAAGGPGAQNRVERFDENDQYVVTIGNIDYRQTYIKAKVSFDAAGTILENMNVTSVARNGPGDFTINLKENLGITLNTMPKITIRTNISGHATASAVRTWTIGAGNASCRIRTYNVNTSADEDFPQVWVEFSG